jgi:hypothetical protein
MIIPFLFLFVAFIVDLGEGHNGCADESRCGHHGPAIRFPFRLNSQPDHCGYPGFNLSCTDTNHTVLELPISVKLFVKKIDYKSQAIQLYDPQHCFPRQLRGLDLSSLPFQFTFMFQTLSHFSLINCSPREIKYHDDKSYQDDYKYISCLSGPSYQVYAVRSYTSPITVPFVSCTKIYTLQSIPDGIIYDNDKVVELEWSSPDCRHCEVMKGKRCSMKNKSSGSRTTECISISKHSKGTYSIYPIHFRHVLQKSAHFIRPCSSIFQLIVGNRPAGMRSTYKQLANKEYIAYTCKLRKNQITAHHV